MSGESNRTRSRVFLALPTPSPPRGDLQQARVGGPLARVAPANDPELDPLVFSVVDSPANGSLSGTAPNLTYTPSQDFNGVDSFTFVANDGEFDSNLGTITITVDPVNDAPVADDQSLTTAEEIDLAIVLSGSDVDLDTLSFAIVDSPANGSLSGTTPNVTYTPALDFVGGDSFTFLANDGELDSELATVTITVTAVNDPPLADDQALMTAEDTDLAIVLTGSDPELDPLTFAIVDSPSDGVLTGTPPNVTYSPSQDFNGSDSFTFEVNDGEFDSPLATVTIDVTAVNDPPEALDQSLSTPEDTDLAIVLTGTDVELDPLSFAIVDSPTAGTLTGTAPDLTYSPSLDFNGSDSFTFEVNDGEFDSGVGTISIDVTAVNDDPVADPQSLVGGINDDILVTLTASDVDGDALSFSIDTEPLSGTLSAIVQVPPTSATVTYSPDPGFQGFDSFVFLVDDSNGGTHTATVDIEITN